MSHSPPRAALVVLAAGEGRRVGHNTNKVLLPLHGRPVFIWSVLAALSLPGFTSAVVVIREQDREQITASLAAEGLGDRVSLVLGGETRHGSEWSAVQHLAPQIQSGALDVVAIHDGARPLASADLFAQVIETAARHGGAIPAVLVTSLLSVDPAEPSPSYDVAGVQTPQAFDARVLLDAYRSADRDRFVGTDTASCIERYAEVEIHAAPGSATNIKVTFPEDVALAEYLLVRSDHPAL